MIIQAIKNKLNINLEESKRGYLNDSLKPLIVGGVKAGLATARDGAYPVARGLNMFTRGQPSAAVQAYLDFILSPRGQKIAVQEGFVPVK